METPEWVQKTDYPYAEMVGPGFRVSASESMWSIEAGDDVILFDADSLDEAKRRAEHVYRAIVEPFPPVIPSCEGSQEDL